MTTGALIHSFIIYKWPKKLITRLNKSVRNFIWSRSIVEKKLVVVPWTDCNFMRWGTRVKKYSIMNDALSGKMASGCYVTTYFVSISFDLVLFLKKELRKCYLIHLFVLP